MLVDELARRWKGAVDRFDRDFQGLLGDVTWQGQRVLLLKPQTYMNLSGQSVAAVVRFYKLDWTDVMVVHDDLDLPPGALRLRPTGSAGGQKGLADVLRHAGTQDVPRLRVGIGKVHRAATVEHVLGRLDAQEREVFTIALARAADAVECWLRRGVEAAMNEFNRREE